MPMESGATSAWSETDRQQNVSERRLFRLLQTLGSRVVPQARLGPFTVDFLLPDLRVVVESDSRLYHLPAEHARRDRLRDGELQDAGYVVIHVWSDDLYREGGDRKVLRHVRLRVLRARGVKLGGPGAESQFARYASRHAPGPASSPAIWSRGRAQARVERAQS